MKTGSGSITAQKVSGDITFGAGSGDIDLSDVNSSSSILTVGSGSGRKTLDTVFAKNIYVISGSGRSNLEQITCTNITMEGSSGDIDFSDLNAQNITIDMVDPSDSQRGGDVRGSIVGKQSEFSVTSHTESGRINLSDQRGLGTKTLDISTDSSNIDISFTE